MNSALLELSAPNAVVPMLGLPTEEPARRELSSSVDGVLRSLNAMMSTLIFGVLQARTRDQFEERFHQAFPDYFRLLRSFSEVAATMPLPQVVRLSVESFDDLEMNLRARGEGSFGPEMTERALFTVFTLRKITPLLYSLATSNRPLNAGDAAKDQDFAKNFLLHALVARFSVDCLVTAMASNRPIYPDVLGSLDNKMRSVVDAYAWARQAADLREEKQPCDPATAFPPLEEDDQALLDESMQDLFLDGI